MTRAGHRNRYKLGDYLADCDRCGFTYFASELQKEWTGFMVCRVCHEPRHPQDLLKVRKEKSVPWTRRPQDISIERVYYADGSWTADGTIDASGSGTAVVDPGPLYVTFGPVDPDSL